MGGLQLSLRSLSFSSIIVGFKRVRVGPIGKKPLRWNQPLQPALAGMQQDLMTFALVAGAGALIGFWLGYAVRAAISRRRRRRAMLSRGWV